MNKARKEKMKSFGEWLVSPFGVFVGLTIVVAIVLIILSIGLIRRSILEQESEWSYEVYDPASDTTIVMMAPTNDRGSGPDYVGFNVLLDNGMTGTQFALFKSAVEQYAKNKEMELSRVSYLKDSYKLAASYVFDFSVVLNVDQETLKVRLDSSAGWKDIFGAKLQLWDEAGNIVSEIEVNDDNVCNYTNTVECGDEGI